MKFVALLSLCLAGCSVESQSFDAPPDEAEKTPVHASPCSVGRHHVGGQCVDIASGVACKVRAQCNAKESCLILPGDVDGLCVTLTSTFHRCAPDGSCYYPDAACGSFGGLPVCYPNY